MQAQRVIFLDTRHDQLPLAMREAYLADVQAWVLGTCRAAVRAGGCSDRSALGLIEALYGQRSFEGSLARWRSIGPHASIRREFQLSDDAVSLMLLAAAPRLWGALTHVYAAICMPGRNFVVSPLLLSMLLGSRPATLRELSADAPLVKYGLIAIRPSGAILASSDVVCRLAGN